MKIKSKCRNCNDPHHVFHCSIVTIGYDSEGSVNEKSYCPCVEYVPFDNLDYLEWCYERQEKI